MLPIYPKKGGGFRLSQSNLGDMPKIFAKQGRREWQRFMDKIINKGLYHRFVLNEKGDEYETKCQRSGKTG